MTEFFPGIAKIKYEGPESKNPLAFKHYNADEKVGTRPWPSTCASRSATGTPSRAPAATRSAPGTIDPRRRTTPATRWRSPR